MSRTGGTRLVLARSVEVHVAHDVRLDPARVRQFDGQRLADARAGSGDDGNFPGKPPP
jgi:hypothetical protein